MNRPKISALKTAKERYKETGQYNFSLPYTINTNKKGKSN